MLLTTRRDLLRGEDRGRDESEMGGKTEQYGTYVPYALGAGACSSALWTSLAPQLEVAEGTDLRTYVFSPHHSCPSVPLQYTQSSPYRNYNTQDVVQVNSTPPISTNIPLFSITVL